MPARPRRRAPAPIAILALATLHLPTAGAQSLPEAQTAADRTPLTEVVVIGSRARLDSTPGSATVIDTLTLERSRVFTVNEALRKVPGVFARDEEGFGLRPNIGIRGLNPNRSSKVLLLEDGLPLTFAPYGDNASYFHPPIERFERIEVLKGSGQIAFGPQTVGGVVNYISGPMPERFGGSLALRGGNRGFRDYQLRLGDRIDRSDTAWSASLVRKTSDGARENMDLDVEDATLRLEQPLGESRALTLRANLYREDSQVPYSGLTRAEYAANPLANPFRNDRFELYRWATSATLGQAFAGGDGELKTSVYYTFFDRDWWRQSSNSAQRPNDASDPACGSLANLERGCGNEGRLRQYYTAGIESRATRELALGNLDGQLSFGARHHVEKQRRFQVNGDSADARTPGASVNGGIREDNRRDVAATSGFVEATIGHGPWQLRPGVRYETVRYERRNLLAGGASGIDRFDELIPGLGATWRLAPSLTLFAGVHRGFAPPRVEDAIGAAGGSVDLDPEHSWNSELGLRYAPSDGLRLEVAAFDLDFENQVVPASVAGGLGATLTSAGRTRHRGLEMSAAVEAGDFAGTGLAAYARTAVTWLARAEYVGERFSSVPGFTQVSVRGNRLPYAPETLATVGFGIESPLGIAAEIEAAYSSDAYTDDLNTVAVTADGQRGRIEAWTVVNLTVSQRIGDALTIYGSVKNLADRRYVADMSRGLIPGTPRQLQFGVDWRF